MSVTSPDLRELVREEILKTDRIGIFRDETCVTFLVQAKQYCSELFTALLNRASDDKAWAKGLASIGQWSQKIVSEEGDEAKKKHPTITTNFKYTWLRYVKITHRNNRNVRVRVPPFNDFVHRLLIVLSQSEEIKGKDYFDRYGASDREAFFRESIRLALSLFDNYIVVNETEEEQQKKPLVLPADSVSQAPSQYSKSNEPNITTSLNAELLNMHHSATQKKPDFDLLSRANLQPRQAVEHSTTQPLQQQQQPAIEAGAEQSHHSRRSRRSRPAEPAAEPAVEAVEQSHHSRKSRKSRHSRPAEPAVEARAEQSHRSQKKEFREVAVDSQASKASRFRRPPILDSYSQHSRYSRKMSTTSSTKGSEEAKPEQPFFFNNDLNDGVSEVTTIR